MNFVTFGRRKNPAIVFLHGWGGSVQSWISVAKVISGFGFYSVVVDFKGFGKSSEPSTPYGVEDYASDIESLIKGLSLTNVTLVGHSFGGRIAIVLGSLNLDVIKKIVLVDSAGIKPKRGIVYKFKVYRYKKAKLKVLNGKKSADVLEKYGSNDYKLLSPVMKETFVKVVNLDLTNYAKMIGVETLLVWGKRDKDTPLYMAKKLNRAIKNSRLVVYDAGHYSYLDFFDRFVDELYEFLVY